MCGALPQGREDAEEISGKLVGVLKCLSESILPWFVTATLLMIFCCYSLATTCFFSFSAVVFYGWDQIYHVAASTICCFM